MCQRCGTPLGPEDAFCPQCGQPAQTVQRSPTSARSIVSQGGPSVLTQALPGGAAAPVTSPPAVRARPLWRDPVILIFSAVAALLLAFDATVAVPRLAVPPRQVVRLSSPPADPPGFRSRGMVPPMETTPSQAWSVSFGDLFGPTDFNTARVVIPGNFDPKLAGVVILFASKPAGADGPAGTMAAFDAKSGTRIWTTQAGTDRFTCAGRAAGANLVCLTGDGLTYYDIASGKAVKTVAADPNARGINVSGDSVYTIAWPAVAAQDLNRPVKVAVTLERRDLLGRSLWKVTRPVPVKSGRDVRELTIQTEDGPVAVTWPNAIELGAQPFVLRTDTGQPFPNLGVGDGRPRAGGVVPVTTTGGQGLQTRVLNQNGSVLASGPGAFDYISTFDHSPDQLPIMLATSAPQHQIVAYDRSGQELWRNADFDDANAFCQGALIARNARTGRFGALDPGTGRTLWAVPFTADPSLQTNVRCDGTHAILQDATGGSNLSAYAVATGVLAWRTPIQPSLVNALLESPAGLIVRQQDQVIMLR